MLCTTLYSIGTKDCHRCCPQTFLNPKKKKNHLQQQTHAQFVLFHAVDHNYWLKVADKMALIPGRKVSGDATY